MANPQHVEVVKLGAAAVKTWRVQNPEVTLNLFDADLSGADLRGANLIDADLSDADLSGADLSGAYLSGAKLNAAKLVEARLNRARLIGTRLNRADFRRANLTKANLRHANLTSASFAEANMTGAKLRGADLRNSNLSRADLTWAKLIGDNFHGVEFTGALCGWTVIADADLSGAVALETVRHRGPSTVGVDTLANSAGKIPDVFLRGCGLTPWQVLQARLHNPALTKEEIRKLHERIVHQRVEGPNYVGGVFISYERADEPFAEKLRRRLRQEGICCWRNPNESSATPFQRGGVRQQFAQQLARNLRQHDVVVLVLSEASTASDWLEHELDMARKIEKTGNRDVLFPVALDESWKSRMTDTSWKVKLEDLLWRHNKTKLVVDFTNWAGEEFENQCKTLLAGLKIQYSPAAENAE